jgi:hypothetical protein
MVQFVGNYIKLIVLHVGTLLVLISLTPEAMWYCGQSKRLAMAEAFLASS